MDRKQSGSTSKSINVDNNGKKKRKCNCRFLPLSSCSSDSEIEDVDSDYTGSFYDLFDQMQILGKGVKGSVALEIPDNIAPKYYSENDIQKTEKAKEIPVPPTFEKRVLITDPKMSGGRVVVTENRASKIFSAISSAVFHSSDCLLTNQGKLMYFRQIEKDYATATKNSDNEEVLRCVHLSSKIVAGYDEPWSDVDWLTASKAFFAPFHVLYKCRRVPSTPHVFRYQFSQVINDEPPVRIIVDNGQ